MNASDSRSFKFVGTSGHTVTLSLRHPSQAGFVVELVRDDTIVLSEQFVSADEAVVRIATMRSNFLECGWSQLSADSTSGSVSHARL